MSKNRIEDRGSRIETQGSRMLDAGVRMQENEQTELKTGNRKPETGLVISCRDLSKTFTLGKLQVPVLKGVSLDVTRGERIAIVG